MRVLMIGPVVMGVSPEIEAGWADLEAASRAFAEDRGDAAPYVHFRTDAGASGSFPLTPRAPVKFDDVDEPDPDHFRGTIVSMLPGDPRTIGRDLSARTPPIDDLDIEGLPEHERLKILADLRAATPEVDHERLAAGNLAGRATTDRPDVPPWDYEQYVSSYPDWTLEQLVVVRFPEVFHENRGSTIRSVAEDLDDHGHPEFPVPTLADALDEWRFLREAGVVRWNSVTRAVEHTADLGEVFAARHEWAAGHRKRLDEDK